jgi:hypothetical protein
MAFLLDGQFSWYFKGLIKKTPAHFFRQSWSCRFVPNHKVRHHVCQFKAGFQRPLQDYADKQPR